MQDATAFGAETFSWKDPVHSWKAGPVEVMTAENLFWREFLSAMCIKTAGQTQFHLTWLYSGGSLSSPFFLVFR